MNEETDIGAIFLDVYSGLPRYGPGSNESTLKALAHCKELPQKPNILDVGCGSGMQTIALAKATGGTVIAIDYYQQYLDEFEATLTDNDLCQQIILQQGDMNDLPFADNTFDLIWSEGAMYIMGIEKALTAWKAFLKPEGYLAFTEVVWLKDNPPEEIHDFWHSEYTDMGSIADKIAIIEKCNYNLIAHFTLPPQDWWAHYYTALEARYEQMLDKYANNTSAQAVLEGTRTELNMHRKYSEWYSYEFFVCRI